MHNLLYHVFKKKKEKKELNHSSYIFHIGNTLHLDNKINQSVQNKRDD